MCERLCVCVAGVGARVRMRVCAAASVITDGVMQASSSLYYGRIPSCPPVQNYFKGLDYNNSQPFSSVYSVSSATLVVMMPSPSPYIKERIRGYSS